jgi:plasmid replication initiation protein
MVPYKLSEITAFKSEHTFRIFELMSKFKKSGWYEAQIIDLRKMLSLENKYKSTGDFKKSVIDKAIKEINEHTALQVTVKAKKHIRTVIAYRFNIFNKNKKQEAETTLKYKKQKEKGIDDYDSYQDYLMAIYEEFKDDDKNIKT